MAAEPDAAGDSADGDVGAGRPKEQQVEAMARLDQVAQPRGFPRA